jgi:plastocyanin
VKSAINVARGGFALISSQHARARSRAVALTTTAALAGGLLAWGVPVAAQTSPLVVIAGVGDGTVAGQAYMPGRVTVRVGDSVTFTIGSDDPHTITFGTGPAEAPPPFWPVAGWSEPEPGSPPPYDLGVAEFDGTGLVNSGILFGKTSSATVTFTAAGTFPVFCAIHPGMAGEVEVVEDGDVTTQEEADAAAALTRDLLLGLEEPVREERLAATATTENADGTTTWDIFADAGTPVEPMPGGGTGFIELLEFLPPELSIGAGDSVRWTAMRAHSVTFIPEGVDPATVFPSEEAAFAPLGGDTYDGTEPVSSGVLGFIGDPPATQYTLTFPQEGVFAYFCVLHAELGQLGTITVSPAS